MDLILHDLALEMRHPFTIALGTTTVQRNLMVELRHGGCVGYGEGAGTHGYSDFTPTSMRKALEAVRPIIEAADFEDPGNLWDVVFPHLESNRFALCALDEAAHDLWGKIKGEPVWKLWGLDLKNLPESNYTIGIDTIETMVAKMKEFDGWPIFKIKLGTADDLKIVQALREETKARFRIDANTSWTVEQTLRLAPDLKDLGVEFIEQPLPADDWQGQKEVFRNSALPIFADESCQTEEDVARCGECFHGINIKLTKAGGMTPARQMISEARGLGLQVMVGCMNESSVGISAIGQLLPLLDYVDMDGAVLLKEDIARGVFLEKGRVHFPAENGNGVQLI